MYLYKIDSYQYSNQSNYFGKVSKGNVNKRQVTQTDTTKAYSISKED